MTVPNSAPVPPPGSMGQQHPGSGSGRKKFGRVPNILVIVGAIILVLSIALGITLTVLGITRTAGGLGDIEVFDSGSGSVTAEAGDDIQFYAEEGTQIPTCEVMGPSPEAIGEGTHQTSSTTKGGRTWASFDSITANEAGEYSFDCGGTPVAVGPPVSIGGIFGAVGGVLLGLGGGFLGFVLVVIGVILLIIRRRAS
ncbi:hypothetical protein [Brachybacterium sp. GCM10030252]|uniref:hypothetical protein n=1 Tax=Brachybacterium sp. GCM10030252 TaxID=3273380 RepID=UPI0036199D4D